MPWINWFSPFPFGSALVVADGHGNSWHTPSKHILAFRLLAMLKYFALYYALHTQQYFGEDVGEVEGEGATGCRKS